MILPTITFPRDAVSRFGEAIAKEWLITNGLGSYASQTVPGINTRKYHGLLVAALNPPGDRTVCLSKIDEDVLVGDNIYRFGSNEFHDIIFPDGYKYIKQFSISPFPKYHYEIDDIALEKTVFLPQNKNAAVVTYKLQNKTRFNAKVRLYPLLTCRYFHTVVDRLRIPFNFTQESNNKDFQITFQRPPAILASRVTDGVFVEGLNWIDRLHYRDEAFRGEADVDDCFQPGYFELTVPAQADGEFAVTTAVGSQSPEVKQVLDYVGSSIAEIKSSLDRVYAHRVMLLDDFYELHPEVPPSDWLNWILLAADSFIVESQAGRKAVIAGYFWFEPWGRDTFISLPGLMLVRGRFSDAKEILQSFMRYCKGGLIPNFVADKTGVPVYNTVDGTLWYINAVLQYLKYTGDFGFVQSELWENLQAIIENHQKGTLFGIHLDNDGLLMHGPRLTWMDAVVDGDMITPRAGKAVEIQALWYNTLRIMELLAEKFGDSSLAQNYASMAEQTRKSFNENFWNPQLHCLFDVVEAQGVDASLRPNQIFAVSLDYTMLDTEKSRRVVELVTRDLVTPYGLRTLSLDDPNFVGKCAGDRRSRDTAYHNGTIWPWLLGPYMTAYLKVNGYSDQARRIALSELVLPLFSVGIHTGGLGTVNEIYDCDVPNVPRGCISQAWSVAEPLRAYVEDVLGIRPKFSMRAPES